MNEQTVCTSYKKPSESQVAGSHYKDMPIQPMEYCYKNKFSYPQANAIKYISRYNFKNGKEDLLKAIHCIQMLMEYEYGGEL